MTPRALAPVQKYPFTPFSVNTALSLFIKPITAALGPHEL